MQIYYSIADLASSLLGGEDGTLRKRFLRLQEGRAALENSGPLKHIPAQQSSQHHQQQMVNRSSPLDHHHQSNAGAPLGGGAFRSSAFPVMAPAGGGGDSPRDRVKLRQPPSNMDRQMPAAQQSRFHDQRRSERPRSHHPVCSINRNQLDFVLYL